MKHKPLPVIVFLTLMLSSLLAGRHSYCTAKEELTADLNQALALSKKRQGLLLHKIPSKCTNNSVRHPAGKS